MDTTLLNSDYLNKNDNIDLLALLKKFETNFKFHENHRALKSAVKPQTREEIETYYNQQDELNLIENWEEIFQKSLQDVEASFPFGKIKKRIQRYQVLEVEELVEAFLILKAFPELQKKIKLSNFEHIDPSYFQKLFRLFFSEAELLFDFKSRKLITYKHSKLRGLDKKIQNTSKEIRTNLAKVSQKWASDDLLQQNEYDLFDDKFVLPVRSDRYNSQLGRIIYRSNTGNTLFIEPFSLRALSNTLEELRAELEREIYKLLKNLSEILGNNIKTIETVFSFVLTIDNLGGRLKCAQRYNLTRPSLSLKRAFSLHGVFNPHIDDPVVNDIKLTANEGGILISGPNTGGKTVLLKSICLCLTLPHLGFFIPAREAEVPIFENLYFLSHDNQSLIDGLSSFSSEAINYLDVVSELKPSSVVFVDEIFNSTSSQEASQLAIALIKQLKHIGCLIFLSSHHELLKERVFEESLLQSGHMGFKEKSSEPTYLFHSGSPGKSFAREVFLEIENKKIGHPIVSRWLGDVSEDRKAFNEKIQDLDTIRDDALSLKKNYEALVEELKKEKANVKNLLEIEKRNLEKSFDRRWNKLKKETLDLTEKVKKGRVTNVVKVSQNLNTIKDNHVNPTTPEKALKGEFKDKYEVGEQVIIKSLNKHGTVLKVQKGRVQVSSGKIKTWVEVKDLLISNEKKKKEERIHVTVHKEKEGRGMQFDARGMRREVFLNKAEAYILDVLNGDLPFVDIVHGHGDGILKKSLYELLNGYKDEVNADFIEGNMGTTRIELSN